MRRGTSGESPERQVGIGIDDGQTALIVEDDRFQVIGRGMVSVYGGRRQAANPIVLRSGDHYNLATVR